MQRSRYPIGDMNTNHDKPLTGFEPAHRVFAELDLNLLATRAEGGERENINKNLSPWNKTPLTMSNLS